MNKTFSITINGILFHFDKEAYDSYNTYYYSIIKDLKKNQISPNVIQDIEQKISEYFLYALDDNNNMIFMEHIISLKENLGELTSPTSSHYINLFTTEEKEQFVDIDDKAQEVISIKKKYWYRKKENRLIAGVAAGLGDMLAIDPLWIRLFIVCLSLNLIGFMLTKQYDFKFSIITTSSISIIYLFYCVITSYKNEQRETDYIKYLYKANNGKMITGVSKGLSIYLDFNVNIIRLLFVLSIFVGGIGIIIYTLLWVLMSPEPKKQ